MDYLPHLTHTLPGVKQFKARNNSKAKGAPLSQNLSTRLSSYSGKKRTKNEEAGAVVGWGLLNTNHQANLGQVYNAFSYFYTSS